MPLETTGHAEARALSLHADPIDAVAACVRCEKGEVCALYISGRALMHVRLRNFRLRRFRL